jgi:hypothetical protein
MQLWEWRGSWVEGEGVGLREVSQVGCPTGCWRGAMGPAAGLAGSGGAGGRVGGWLVGGKVSYSGNPFS